MRDNAFLRISDWEKSQQLSNHIRVEDLHQVLDILANRYCPVIKKLHVTYRWSIMQVEYATDIVFKAITHKVTKLPDSKRRHKASSYKVMLE